MRPQPKEKTKQTSLVTPRLSCCCQRLPLTHHTRRVDLLPECTDTPLRQPTRALSRTCIQRMHSQSPYTRRLASLSLIERRDNSAPSAVLNQQRLSASVSTAPHTSVNAISKTRGFYVSLHRRHCVGIIYLSSVRKRLLATAAGVQKALRKRKEAELKILCIHTERHRENETEERFIA